MVYIHYNPLHTLYIPMAIIIIYTTSLCACCECLIELVPIGYIIVILFHILVLKMKNAISYR